MGNNRKNTKQEIIQAACRLIAKKGIKGTTIRDIAGEVGVTEGAIYRHFSSKDALCFEIHERTVEEMAEVKEQIAAKDQSFRESLREWVEVTFEYYDKNPDAFTYVLIMPLDSSLPPPEITLRQGRLFRKILQRAMKTGEIARMPVDLAFCHFTGLMLNVPRLINEEMLKGPASKYARGVTDAILRALKSEK